MKQNNNIIHRCTTKLLIKLKVNTNLNKKDDIIKVVYIKNYGWIGGGGRWFLEHLRNNNFCEILKQE